MKSLLAKLGWTVAGILAVAWAVGGAHWFRATLFTLVWLMLIWPAFQRAWGSFMSRLVLTVIYLGALPIGLAVRLFSDPLRVKPKAADSHWLPRPPEDETLAEAAKQG